VRRAFWITTCALTTMLSGPFAQAVRASSNPDPSLKQIQAQADELSLKSEAIDNLIPLLSHLRTQRRADCHYMGAFLKSEGKLKAYLGAKITVAKDPAAWAKALGNAADMKAIGITVPDHPITFEQTLGMTIDFVKSEDHRPADVADQSEMDTRRRLYEAKEKLARRVWSEFRALARHEASMRTYLKSIGQFDEYGKWVHTQVEKDKAAREAELAKRREAGVKARAGQERQRTEAAHERLRRHLQREHRKSHGGHGNASWHTYDPFEHAYTVRHGRRYYHFNTLHRASYWHRYWYGRR
jgi:hypothetical protein